MCTSESRIESPSSKLKENPHPVKIEVTVKTPIGVILVVTLIRTETTLDHSQKAEKVYPNLCSYRRALLQDVKSLYGSILFS